MGKENIIQTKSFNFALKIIRPYQKLTEHNEYILSKQLLRSGTSIGANVEEAIAGLSKKRFYCKDVNLLKRITRNTLLVEIV